jgi:hypothetical protein
MKEKQMAEVATVADGDKVVLILSAAEAQAVSTLVSHVAQKPECYDIGHALDRGGIEFDGTDLELYDEATGQRVGDYGYIKFPN